MCPQRVPTKMQSPNPANREAKGPTGQAFDADGVVSWSSRDHFGRKVVAHGVFLKQVSQHLQPTVQVFASAEGNQDGGNLGGARSDHGALGIAGGAAVRSARIAEERKILEIEIVLADAFVGFTSAAGAKDNLAFDLP